MGFRRVCYTMGMKPSVMTLLAAIGAIQPFCTGCFAPSFESASMQRVYGDDPYGEHRSLPADALPVILPERAMNTPECARLVLERIEAGDASLSEEDLLVYMLLLVRGGSYWMNLNHSGETEGLALQLRLMAAIERHPAWSGRHDGYLRAYAQRLVDKNEYQRQYALEEHYGVKYREQDRSTWVDDYPLDGTWTDWLKPAAAAHSDRLTWSNAGGADHSRQGWFKAPPGEPLPFAGRILCLLENRRFGVRKDGRWSPMPLYTMIFTFASEAELEAAIVAVNGGIDKRIYGEFNNLVHLPEAKIPPCAWLDYRDEENGCYLLSISSTWTWDKSSWFFLPDTITPPGAKKKARRR